MTSAIRCCCHGRCTTIDAALHCTAHCPAAAAAHARLALPARPNAQSTSRRFCDVSRRPIPWRMAWCSCLNFSSDAPCKRARLNKPSRARQDRLTRGGPAPSPASVHAQKAKVPVPLLRRLHLACAAVWQASSSYRPCERAIPSCFDCGPIWAASDDGGRSSWQRTGAPDDSHCAISQETSVLPWREPVSVSANAAQLVRAWPTRADVSLTDCAGSQIGVCRVQSAKFTRSASGLADLHCHQCVSGYVLNMHPSLHLHPALLHGHGQHVEKGTYPVRRLRYRQAHLFRPCSWVHAK